VRDILCFTLFPRRLILWIFFERIAARFDDSRDAGAELLTNVV